MVYLLKLLYKFNISVKYATYIILFLSMYLILNLLTLHYNVHFKATLFKPRHQYNISKPPKYIFLWNHNHLIMNWSESVFSQLKCKVNNCIFSDDKTLFGEDTQFDAIIFDHFALTNNKDKPQNRSNSQIYVFATIESSYNFPACELYNDDFFNWTFTYRLDSDIVWNYFVVRNSSGHAVAPSKEVQWKTSYDPIDPKIKTVLYRKKKAAAWLVSNCIADSYRDEYLSRLQEHLFHFSLKIDVYGYCSNQRCANDDCEDMLWREYYFYMAFENSFSDDYVTEKVLHGYNNYAVPIVYGLANYSRFLPPGSYINARELHPYNLAFLMNKAINNSTHLESYFRWTNSYIIDAYPRGLHPLCKFCEALNSRKVEYAPANKNFRFWWNGLNGMKWCLSKGYWNESYAVNVNGDHIFSLY